MNANDQYYNNKKIENENLLSFMVETYTDTQNIGTNVRLLRECLLEWQNTNLEIQTYNDNQIPARDVGRASGVWALLYPEPAY
jgi:hypothetical protein